MNIDVTATDGDRTWSEKFTDVTKVNMSREGHAIIMGDDEIIAFDPGAGTKYGDHTVLASFAPGSWHSWRQIF